MAWRNQGTTGSNNIPLGTKRRFPGDESPTGGDHGGGYKKEESRSGLDNAYSRRGRSPERRKLSYSI